jgi:hypothetical protein
MFTQGGDVWMNLAENGPGQWALDRLVL